MTKVKIIRRPRVMIRKVAGPSVIGSGGGEGGVTDHGLLTGLSDDDHPQYLNNSRGDSRYYTKTVLDAGQLDNRYYTETESDAALALKASITSLKAVAFSNSYTDLDNKPALGTMAFQSLDEFYSSDEVDSLLSGKANTSHDHYVANILDFNTGADARIAAQKGQNSGLATLGVDGKIPTSQLPALVTTETFVVANQSAQLALTAQAGDFAIRSDESKTYVHNGGTAGNMSDWTALLTTPSVVSVNGMTGVVTVTTSHVTEGTNLYWTSARFDTAFAGKSLDDLAAGTTNKHFTDTEKSKLAGITSGATANDTDANLKNRANHTGTQTASTINDFTAAAKTAAVANAIVDGVNDVAPSQNAVFNALALKAAKTQTDFISGLIETPDNKDYKIITKAPYSGTITSVTTISTGGTCTATTKINTTALGGTANSVSTSEQTQNHASSNAFSAGDDIVITVSAKSACTMFGFTIEFTRTLS